MIRRPPRSTLFPYTRSSDLVNAAQAAAGPIRPVARLAGAVPPRSEEHTSELQSHSHLVCRLLLAKTPSPHRGGGAAARPGDTRPAGPAPAPRGRGRRTSGGHPLGRSRAVLFNP